MKEALRSDSTLSQIRPVSPLRLSLFLSLLWLVALLIMPRDMTRANDRSDDPGDPHPGGIDVPRVLAGDETAASSTCAVLDREKWIWHGWLEDFLPPAYEDKEKGLQSASFPTCWECCLWPEASWPPSAKSPVLSEALSYRRARCYEVLQMQGAALDAYRGLLERYPDAEMAPACVESIVSLLSNGGNGQAAIRFFQQLISRQKERASAETLYMLGQCCYQEKQYDDAASYLIRVPADSDLFPLALYAQAQIAFIDGDMDLAETHLRSLADAENQSKIPEMLRDRATLTLARVLYQEGKYNDAAGYYRKLSRSAFFLTEALMGMGSCYEAIGETDKAIAYFRSAEEASSRDFLSMTAAGLEKARLLSASGMYTDSFRALKSIQNRTNRYIALVNRHINTPDWLDKQARILFQDGKKASASVATSDVPFFESKTEEEAQYVLQKQRYVSPRIRKLYAIPNAIEQVESMLEGLPEPDSAKPFKQEGVSTVVYPPMQAQGARPDGTTIGLLDASIALLDTEYRMDEVTASLGLVGHEDRKTFFQDTESFYRTAFRKIVRFTPEDARDAYAALNRMMALVCNLPGSLEERERMMNKLLYTKESLKDSEESLLRWEQSMRDADSGAFATSRPVLLDLWMVYVRTLIFLGTWTERSPAVFLLPILDSMPQKESADAAPIQTKELLASRIAWIWQQLETCLRREIHNIFSSRLRAAERMLIDSETYYAEALLQYQKSLLKEIQSVSPEIKGEGTPSDQSGKIIEEAPAGMQAEPRSETTGPTEEARPEGEKAP